MIVVHHTSICPKGISRKPVNEVVHNYSEASLNSSPQGTHTRHELNPKAPAYSASLVTSINNDINTYVLLQTAGIQS